MTDSTRVVKFIDATIADILERPLFYGPSGAAEHQVLRLLEVRLIATSQAPFDTAGSITQRYVAGLPADHCQHMTYLRDFVSRIAPEPITEAITEEPKPIAVFLRPHLGCKMHFHAYLNGYS